MTILLGVLRSPAIPRCTGFHAYSIDFPRAWWLRMSRLAPRAGLEPATNRLTADRSTN